MYDWQCHLKNLRFQHNFNPQMSKKFERKTLRSQKLRFLLIQFQLILCKTFIFLLEKLWNNLKVFGLVLKWLRSGRIYSGEGKTRFEYFHHIARSKKSVWKKSTWKNELFLENIVLEETVQPLEYAILSVHCAPCDVFDRWLSNWTPGWQSGAKRAINRKTTRFLLPFQIFERKKIHKRLV